MSNAKRAKAIKRLDAGDTHFDTWFTAQYGGCPSRESVFDLAKAVRDAQYRLAVAERIFQRMNEWQTRRDAAFKAWLAAETKGPNRRRGR